MILTVTLNASIDKLYMIKRLDPYTVMRVEKVINTAGGKGMNVARVAAGLGEKVTATGFVGGFIGQYFESLITEANIRRAFTHVASETRSCINGWDMTKNESTEYLEPGAPVTGEEVERFYEDFARELAHADVVTLSGSLPEGMPKDAYGRLIALCRDAGKRVLLDTSGEALKRAVKALPTLVKPNKDEIAQLLGHEVRDFDEVVGAARKLYETGVALVAVSLGAEGALLVSRDGAWHGRPPRITPVNTVGCGDGMLAGFAVGLGRGLHPKEMLRLAVAVSAAGALSMATGGYDPADFDRIYPKITIDTIF